MYKFVFCRCQFDYLDIYAEVTDATLPFIDTPLLGRFCGDGTDRLPNLIISTSNIIILDFYSDYDKADKGFQGRYKFINDCRCITGWIGDYRFITGWIGDCRFITGWISDCRCITGWINDCRCIAGWIGDCRCITGWIGEYR